MAERNIQIDDSTEALDEALQELIDQYNSLGNYQGKTADQMQAQAEGEYNSYYDQLKLAAQQNRDTQDLALQQQRDSLQAAYDKQREASAKAYDQSYSQADRQMLSRGMQRSSYGAATLGNIGSEKAKAQGELNAAQTTAETNIDKQRTQLAQQLSQTLAGYDTNKAADVLNRVRQLEDQEYSRGVENRNTRNSLAAQIYEYMANRQQQQMAQNQWQAQFDENVRQFNAQMDAAKAGGSGGGGGSYSYTGGDTTNNVYGNTATPAAVVGVGTTYRDPEVSDLISALNGGASKKQSAISGASTSKVPVKQNSVNAMTSAKPVGGVDVGATYKNNKNLLYTTK